MKRFLLGLSVLTLVVGATSPARAESSIGMQIARKAARGVENVVLGAVTEVPKTVYHDSVGHGIPHGVTVGTVKGIGLGTLRTGIGIYEVATFPVPLPKHYKPMLYPEFPHELGEPTH